MKKLIVIMILFLTSLAYGTEPYVIPKDISDRSVRISNHADKCLKSIEEKNYYRLYIARGKEPNAWVTPETHIYITEGMFKYDDNVIAFVFSHELAHLKLNHIKKVQAVSVFTTLGMLVANVFVPGAGLLNYGINPAVTSNFSKTQEYDADKLASETLTKCFNVSIDKQVQILKSLQKDSEEGGGFWSKHPAWSDRIENLKSH